MGYPPWILRTLRLPHDSDRTNRAAHASRTTGALIAPNRKRVGRNTAVGERRTAMEASSEHEALLTPSEVAAMFRVNPKTVTRWARAGKISAIRTLGGHRRFRESEIRRFLEQVEESDHI